MSPATHLLASWVVADYAVRDRRTRLRIVLAGIAPDLDGLGLALDQANVWLGRPETDWYGACHHFLLHGILGAALALGLAALAGTRTARGLVWIGVSFHLHLLCDVVGSRGPAPEDLWAIHYLGPFLRSGAICWSGQWALNAWPNFLISIALLGWIGRRTVVSGISPLSLVSARLDTVVVHALQTRFGSGA
jgi:hypothetical protein